jgi:hypothetical protein
MGKKVRVGPGPGDVVDVKELETNEAIDGSVGAMGIIEEFDSDESDEISRVLSELGGDIAEAKVQVWRVTPGNKKGVFVDEIPPHEFSMKNIADDYGGGLYNIKVFVPRYDEEGIKRGVKLVANPRIEIDGPPKTPKREEEKQSSGDLGSLAKLFSDGFERLTKVIESQQRPQNNLVEMITALKTLDELRGRYQPPPPAPQDQFTMFERAVNIIGKMKAAAEGAPVGANENDILLEIVRSFAPAIAEGVKKLPDTGNVPSTLPEPPQPLPENVRPITSAPILQETEPMNLIITGYVRMLCNAALKNESVDSYAEMIAEQAPDDMLDAFLENPEWLNILAQFDERVRSCQKWFEALRAKIIELTNQDETP